MTTYPKKQPQQPQQGQTAYANRTPQQPQGGQTAYANRTPQPSQPQQQRKPQPPQGPQPQETQQKAHLPYLNVLIMTGRLGEDPQLLTINNKEVYRFSLACWQSREKPTIWLKVYVYSPELHERVSSLSKGTEIQVVGKFTYDIYQETVQLGILANDISLTPLSVSVDPQED